jgi:hypothetical protein
VAARFEFFLSMLNKLHEQRVVEVAEVHGVDEFVLLW